MKSRLVQERSSPQFEDQKTIEDKKRKGLLRNLVRISRSTYIKQTMSFRPKTIEQGVEPNLNPYRKPEWTVSLWWTRTEPEPAKFYFSEPEPNLNPQNCAQVNRNRTWTPSENKNIFFHMRMLLALVHAQ